MTRNIIKIIDATVAAARLYAATRRIPELRHIAMQLHIAGQKYDAEADRVSAAMREKADV